MDIKEDYSIVIKDPINVTRRILQSFSAILAKIIFHPLIG